ncbi:octanoyl-[acyl-carrier-protein]:protein N-octanoyltransferase LIPT2, mitochondrial isoform X2 [Lampetra fluviatilis]
MAAAVAAGRVVRVVSLGRVGYAQALAVQTRLARALLDHLAAPSGPAPPDTLLLCEHEPVYTVGIRQAPYPAEVETRLRALGADFHRTNRGGLITFHGPGQLVCYPVLHLARHRRSLRWYPLRPLCDVAWPRTQLRLRPALVRARGAVRPRGTGRHVTVARAGPSRGHPRGRDAAPARLRPPLPVRAGAWQPGPPERRTTTPTLRPSSML